jgi:hypothetical protein
LGLESLDKSDSINQLIPLYVISLSSDHCIKLRKLSRLVYRIIRIRLL